jgi:hypothetical protein
MNKVLYLSNSKKHSFKALSSKISSPWGGQAIARAGRWLLFPRGCFGHKFSHKQSDTASRKNASRGRSHGDAILERVQIVQKFFGFGRDKVSRSERTIA